MSNMHQVTCEPFYINEEDRRRLWWSVIHLGIKDLLHVCHCTSRKKHGRHVQLRLEAILWFLIDVIYPKSFMIACNQLSLQPSKTRKRIFSYVDTCIQPKHSRKKLSTDDQKQSLVYEELCFLRRSSRHLKTGKACTLRERLHQTGYQFMELACGEKDGYGKVPTYVDDMVIRCTTYALGLNLTPWSDLLYFQEGTRCQRTDRESPLYPGKHTPRAYPQEHAS